MARKQPTWTWSDVASAAPARRLTIVLDERTDAGLQAMADTAGLSAAVLAASLVRAIVEDDAAAHEGGV